MGGNAFYGEKGSGSRFCSQIFRGKGFGVPRPKFTQKEFENWGKKGQLGVGENGVCKGDQKGFSVIELDGGNEGNVGGKEDSGVMRGLDAEYVSK
jgi:hypothetical protein